MLHMGLGLRKVLLKDLYIELSLYSRIDILEINELQIFFYLILFMLTSDAYPISKQLGGKGN